MLQFNRWGVFTCNQSDTYTEIAYPVLVSIPGFWCMQTIYSPNINYCVSVLYPGLVVLGAVILPLSDMRIGVVT